MSLRLLGNTVLICPLPDADIQVSAGGIFLVNKHKKTNLKYSVLAVGPGGFQRRKKRQQVFLKPECEVGDTVLVRAELDDYIVKHTFDDGTGRLIIHGHDARGNSNVLMAWKEKVV